MPKTLMFLLAAVGATVAAVPVAAQQNDKELIIYGNDKCPAGTVCIRAKEEDRYRIPQTLRGSTLAPQNQPWAARAPSVARADAASGAGSCSAAGAGGWTGCWNRDMKNWRDERKQQAVAGSAAPPPQ